MDEGYTWLKGIADRMKSEVAKGAAPGPERLTVRKMLEQFGYQRRSDGINNHIRNVLEEFMLRTNEDFTAAWPDSPITIELDSDAAGASAAPRTSDPTHRVSAFLDRKSPPASVKPESSLKEATTIMQMNHYSRLPVMKNEREVSGIVTWQSIGTRLALGLDCTYVRQCMQPAEVIPADTRLFDAVNKVAEHGYVLVRGEKNVITGIVTATDVAHLFEKLARPFLLIGEIEDHVRNLIQGKFTLDQLQAASGEERSIDGLADLTFGGYRRLLENKDNWKRLNLDIDRAEFIRHLDAVRKIRNEVVHFNPKGLNEVQLKTIRNVARFFDHLARMTSA